MRSILFDVDGVVIHSLFHQDPTRQRVWSQHIEMDFGISRDSFNEFFRLNYAEIVTGKTSIVTAMDAFLPTIGADHINSLDLLEYWFKNDTPVNRQLLDGIKQLKQKADVKVYLATNQEHLRAFYLWHDLKLSHIFDDMFYAARLGAAKPDPSFFQKVDHLLGPQSEAPLFFDDGQKNVDAGIAQGWDSVLFETEADFFNHPWVNKFLK